MRALRQRRTHGAGPDGHGDTSTDDFTPIRMVEVEIGDAIPDLAPPRTGAGELYVRARALVRLHTQPLGFLDLPLHNGTVPAPAMAAAIWDAFGPAINAHLHDDGLPPLTHLTAGGVPGIDTPYCLRAREAFLATAPFASVVIATRDRTEQLVPCLDAALLLDYPRYEVIVVDNAPTSTATAALIAARFAGTPRVHYVREDRPGLSQARMRGFAHARGEIVAFTDDDIIVDRHWLAALAQGFTAGPRVGCVTGAVIAREIETIEQQWCEERGGFTKGFARQVFDLDAHRRAEPFYPFRSSMFGTGANGAFNAQTLRLIGGLDLMLGAGTPAHGGEDLDIYFRIIDADFQLVYEPAALVHHTHRRTYRALRDQSYGYGVSLTAYLMKCVMAQPRRLLTLVRAMPYGMRYALSPHSPKNRHKTAHFPRELTRVELQGMLLGPLAYFRSRRVHQRMTHGAH